MRTASFVLPCFLFVWVTSEVFSAPILATDRPPFSIKSCGASMNAVPFEIIPSELVGRSFLFEAYLASVNPAYARPRVAPNGTKRKIFPSFNGIGTAYERWCTAYGVRWDWAFVQMLHETDFLRYTGSVAPDSFNFAGLAAVHETAAGEQFADLNRGVKAHCQHLAAYALLELPRRKCGPNEAESLDCVEAERTLSVMEKVIQYNVCKQFRRPAQFSELGPDDVPPCTERKVTVRGKLIKERLCPGDIVRWASGALATGYSQAIGDLYERFVKKLEACSKLASAPNAPSPPVNCSAPSNDNTGPEQFLKYCLSLGVEGKGLEDKLASSCTGSIKRRNN